MYRYDWLDSGQIHYYTEFMGMKDTIHHEDLLVDVSKAEIEKELELEKQQRMMLSDELADVRKQLRDINSFMNQLTADPETVKLLAKKAQFIKNSKFLSTS